MTVSPERAALGLLLRAGVWSSEDTGGAERVSHRVSHRVCHRVSHLLLLGSVCTHLWSRGRRGAAVRLWRRAASSLRV